MTMGIRWSNATETGQALVDLDPEAKSRPAPLPRWLARTRYPNLEGATMHPGGADLTGQVVHGVNSKRK